METISINGREFTRMLEGGFASLAAHSDELNALNVFPVADGDTGTNMAKTMAGGLAALKAYDGNHIEEVSKLFSRGVLLSARGNSGVILSQMFAGMHEQLQSCDTVDAVRLADAFQSGVSRAYQAVQNPTEGTILTVFRESSAYVASKMENGSTLEDFFELLLYKARCSLRATKELLPALAEADVVDSGAAGYVYIAMGMYEALQGNILPDALPITETETQTVDIDSFTRDSVLEFGYCTEFLLRLTTAKVDPDTFDIQTILSILDELQGESVVAYKQEDIVKVHVHTYTPGVILARMQAFGEFLTVKIENMSLSHSEEMPKKPATNKPFSVVAVATGDGLCALFEQMGADCIINGGQTVNPSTEDFINAFKRCDGHTILVLPNNKNVFLAAKQAADLYPDADVRVIETKNLVQGYSALSVITPGISDIEALITSATRAAQEVAGGEVTRAVRDAVIGGTHIRAGAYMALGDSGLVAVTDTPEQAVLRLLEQADTEFCELITLFVGKTVSDDARAALTAQLKDLYDDCEVTVYIGGQDVYDYFVAIE